MARCNKYLVAGSTLITIGIIFFVIGIIMGIVIQVAFIPRAFDNYLVYKPDDRFATAEYEKCSNQSFNAFMFNMTNSEDFLAGAALPNFEQVGPYNFTRKTCQFNITNDDNNRYYKQYWEPYYLLPSDLVSDSDVFVNLNPGYLSVLFPFQQRTSDPETALATLLVGPTLQQIIEGMQTQTFIDQAKVFAFLQLMTQVRPTVIVAFNPFVKLTASANVIAGTIAAVPTTPLNFFNFVGIPNGVATFLGSNPNFSNQTVQLLLYGTGTATQPSSGWLSDLTTGSGFIAFFQLLTTNTTAVQALYNIDSTQLNQLRDYINNKVLLDLWVNPQLPNETAVVAQATNLFYQQWANSAVSSTGLDINMDGMGGDGFELSPPAGLTTATATALWNETNPLSFLNQQGVQAWFAAIQAYQATGSTDGFVQLLIAFQLSQPQLQTIATWLGTWQQTRITPYILAQFSITDLTQLAYIQWGQGAFGGRSVADFQTLPAAPEFSVWAARNNVSVSFELARSIQIINLFQGTSGAAPQFLALLSNGDTDTILTLYNFTVPEAIAFGGYLNYLTVNFVDTMLRQISAIGGGLVTRRTPREILFEAVDPLASLLVGPTNAHAGLFYDSKQDYPTRADAELNQPLQSEAIFNGGGNDKLEDFLQIKEYRGSPVIAGYANLSVSGNKDGLNWVPGSLSQTEPLYVWISVIQRAVKLVYAGEINVKGIDCWKYEIADDAFQPVEQNPDNAPFDQHIYGLVNITGIKTLYTFVTRPHFTGVTSNEVLSTFTGAKDSEDTDYNQFFAINPLSGITFLGQLTAQGVVQYPKLTRYSNVTGGFAPIAWQDNYQVATDDQASQFKNGINQATGYAIIAYVLGGGLGIILIAIGIFILVKYRSATATADDVELQTVKASIKKKKPTAAPTKEEEEGTSTGSSGSSDDEEGSSYTDSSEGSSSEGTSEEGSTATSSQTETSSK